MLFSSEGTLKERLEDVEAMFSANELARQIIDFIKAILIGHSASRTMSQRQAADGGSSSAPKATKVLGPLGIIAGRGSLPPFIAETASADNIPFHIVGIRGEADPAIERFPHTWIKWGEVREALRRAQEE